MGVSGDITMEVLAAASSRLQDGAILVKRKRPRLRSKWRSRGPVGFVQTPWIRCESDITQLSTTGTSGTHEGFLAFKKKVTSVVSSPSPPRCSPGEKKIIVNSVILCIGMY